MPHESRIRTADTARVWYSAMGLPKKVAVVIALAVSVSACSGGTADNSTEIAQDPSTTQSAEERTTCDRVIAGEIIQAQDGVFEVCEMNPTYETTGQVGDAAWGPDAAFGLSAYGLGATGGPGTLNHPSSGASDGKYLVVADRFNNRVLVFNDLPTGPADPELVIGQPDFMDITPGSSLSDMNWPGGVEITPDGKLLVADTENGRVLVFLSIPSTNGAPADFALDLQKLTGEADSWPWGVWSDGESLVVTDTRKGNVLVWDRFPTTAETKPSAVTNPNGVGTPRNITSDGSNFMIGDENGSQESCWGAEPQNKMRQSHIWVNRLPIGDPDGCVWDWYQGDTYNGGVIALAAGGRDVHYWPSFPVDATTAMARTSTGGTPSANSPAPPEPGVPAGNPDQPQPSPQPVEPGQPMEPGATLPPIAAGNTVPSPAGDQGDASIMTNTGHSYLGGDGGDVVVTSSAVYFIEYNGNRVTGWNEVPESLESKVPDFSVFDENPDISTLLRDGIIQNPVLVKTGTSLVATSDYDRRMHVWTSFPGSNGARADYTYLTGFPAWDNSYADGTLVIAGKESVAVWRTFTPGALPDQVLKGQIGSVAMDDIRGVAYDGTYLALADREMVSVFEGIPSAGQQPIRQYAIRGPGRLDLRNGLLAIAPREGADVYLVDVSTTKLPTKLSVTVNLPMQAKFIESGLAIADTSHHRVQIWNEVTSVIAGAQPDLILGGSVGERPQTSRDRFYFPSSIEEANGILYVGEFKFSNRVLAFSR